MMKFTTLLSLVLLVMLAGCNGEDTQYLFHENVPVQPKDGRNYPLSTLEVDKNIDVLFVIDNSGSMDSIQQNVIKNAKLFIEKFAKVPYINWKIGVISTDQSDNPYIGFENNNRLDYTMVDQRNPSSIDKVVGLFQTAVASLGTSGSASEYTFYNVKRILDTYDGINRSPRFLRSNSHLVVIMITDEPEQSKTAPGVKNPSFYEANNFFNALDRYIDTGKILRFYGAFNHKELKDCTENYAWTQPWKGNPFDAIIGLSQGFYISACTDDFGKDLARIGEDIVTLIGLPSLLLKRRPLVDTIRVYYKGELLPPGPEADGGVWFYEEESNTINFYNMDFVDDFENDHFIIDFDIDDGIQRQDD